MLKECCDENWGGGGGGCDMETWTRLFEWPKESLELMAADEVGKG